MKTTLALLLFALPLWAAPPVIVDPPPYFPDPPVLTVDAAYSQRLVDRGWTIRPDAPAYDPATQRPPIWDKASGKWIVSQLSQAELDAATAAAADATVKGQVQALLTALNAGTATTAQMQKALAWLIKHYAQ